MLQMPASRNSMLAFSPTIPTSSPTCWGALVGHLIIWTLPLNAGGMDGVLGSWLWPAIIMAIMIIWEVNQRTENDFSFFSVSSFGFQIKKCVCFNILFNYLTTQNELFSLEKRLCRVIPVVTETAEMN